MVKIVNLLLLFLVANCAHASSLLISTMPKNTIEIGKPMLVTIIATDINEKLSSINLDALEHDFGIEIRENSVKSDKASTIQLLKIALYPRHIGEATLPELSLSRYKTKETRITIKPAKTAIGGIEFSSSLSSNNVWQRQQIIISATITTPSKFSRIELEEFPDSMLETVTIDVKTTKLAEGLYKHSSGWEIYPLISGKLLLNPPAIYYKLNGVIQRKFFPLTESVYVKELPSYIPPLMPVGTLKFTSTIEEIERNNHSHLWTVELKTNDIMPSSLSNLTMPLDRIPNIEYGEIKYSALASGSKMTLPISFKSNGLFTSPEITYKTFNPESGRISSVTTLPISMLVLNPWIKLIIFVLFSYLVIVLFYFSFKYSRRIYIHYKNKQEIVNSTLVAETPCQLHGILKSYADNQGWGNNLTLIQWLSVWEKYSTREANNTIYTLSLACYGNNHKKNLQENLNRQVYTLLKK